MNLPPGCPPRCRGCAHRGLTEEASSAQKEGWIRTALAPWGDRIAPLRSPDPQRRRGYRERVRLATRWDGKGWRFGMLLRDELVPLEDCPLHAPRVRAALNLFRPLPPPPAVPLAFVTLTGAQATLVVKASHPLEPPALDFSGLEAAGLEGLWLHHHPAAGRRIFGRGAWCLLWGIPESRNPLGLLYGPASFQQALPELYALSLDQAEAHLAPGPGDGTGDLYCGDGASLARWRARGSEALGVEISGSALGRAARNAPGCVLLQGTCGQRAPQIRGWLASFPQGMRRAYLNPPRTGLETEVAAMLTDCPAGRLAYLSCAARTLRRDLELLEAGGYEVVSLTPYDFFPRTDHVETLALLEGP